MIGAVRTGWQDIIQMPIGNRTEKPRDTGLTFTIDRGLGLSALKDILETAADYIDRIKLAFGTSVLFKEGYLLKKIQMVRDAQIDINPGGTLTEIAIYQGVYDLYLRKAREYGFNTIEISDDTITMDGRTRQGVIEKAVEAGFKVFTKVTKTDYTRALAVKEMIYQIKKDLSWGAARVIVEPRGAMVLASLGQENRINDFEVCLIAQEVDIKYIVWGATSRASHDYFIRKFGNNVNLGNIYLEDILSMEGLRRGLRGDTLRHVVYQIKLENYI